MRTGTNVVILDGNLGGDPELRYTASGIPVANLRLATTTESRKSSAGKWDDISQWHRVVIWGPDAERVSKEAAKGDRVRVEGMLTYRKWADNQGQERIVAEVKAAMVKTWAKDKSREAPTKNDEPSREQTHPSFDDDIPF